MRWPELSSLGIVADVVEVWRRDAYGFAVRPQHLQRFREYAKIYKEEEDERTHRWKDFLDRLAESADLPSTPSIHAAAAGDAESAEKSVKEEHHEAENTDTDKNLEYLKEADGNEELREVNGEPGDIKGVTSNLETPKEDSSSRGADCDDEEEEGEAEERNIKIECVDEVGENDESIEAKGKPEDFEDVTGNSEKLKEESTADCVTLNKASEKLKEINECSEEIKVINGGSEEFKDQNGGLKELGEVKNDNFKRFEEIPFDKGLLDELEPIKVESWRRVRASLSIIEKMMSSRVIKRNDTANAISGKVATQLASIEEDRAVEETHEGNSAEESHDAEKADRSQDGAPGDPTSVTLEGDNGGSYFPWREELESLVRGGVPIALRGEMWQAFVGVGARKITGYYNKLLDERTDVLDEKDLKDQVVNEQKSSPKKDSKPEKWKGQIEKDLPRTFPGHPALDEDGRNALRRLLTAYARHNPSVGYCQAMNFFAGLFLLFMPEENAFWALVGVVDEYFEGYYTEEMIESQVDQLVLEDVVRERFPKLAKHTDILGVQVTWVTGPWFLSIFINMLPWESGQINDLTIPDWNFSCLLVLRVWDVILFEGNRTMLFRTTLALLDLYGPALVTTKDAGDAITLLQSLAGSTFDSSQLVLTACMGFQSVKEMGLQELREKHRPEIIAAMEERSKDRKSWKDKKGLATKLYSFKHDPSSVCPQVDSKEGADGLQVNGDSGSTNLGSYLTGSALENELDEGIDLQDQVTWLKVELCKLLEEKRSAELREDSQVENLEAEVSEFRRTFEDKQEQEKAMLEILLRMEQEQKVTEDARIAAERDAAEQKYAAHLIQEKYEAVLIALSQMEKRAVMAETMLEATKQYQAGQVKAVQTFAPKSPHADLGKINQEPNQDTPNKKVGLLSRGLGWLEKSKGKSNPTETNEG
ncbi:TBC1 domain family member 9B [Triticum urartu]|uniref:TBC1 domain family member 9B n=1 Tax=Triticum urartu TaxID=4572 RepID=M8A882_TRIUA|nr:TBC1 domain family member 9B [Triticum urartu]